MAGSIYDWSTTASVNDTADSTVNWQEGQAANTVNDSARAMMARIAALVDDLGGVNTVGGTANAITVAAASGYMAYADGMLLTFKASASNTGAVTVNVNGISIIPIRKISPAGLIDLAAGDIAAGGRYSMLYDAASSVWVIISGAGGSSSDGRALALIVGLSS